ncbi:hypothetical protein ONS96_012680 [Cadophora gregata f. sp. sojae]|nr:hypothetical protein ONS96_012680 [Cadophora gregata f. sp. sojae]
MKIQPPPEREEADFTKDELAAPTIEITFAPPSIMDNPLPATAVKLSKRLLQEQLKSEEECSTTTPAQQSLSPDFPEMPSDPTPDTILEWLSSPQHGSSCSSPRPKAWLHSAQQSQLNRRQPKDDNHCTRLQHNSFLCGSDAQATVDHIEHSTENLVAVPESRLQILEAKMRRAELLIQISDLEKEILKTSLCEKDFIIEEQKVLHDDTELKELQKTTDEGLELLKRIQYENPICKDDPSVFQEAYHHWVGLRQRVVAYLTNRSTAQHENEIKWQKCKDLYPKRKALLVEIEGVDATISRLECPIANGTELENNSSEKTELKQADVDRQNYVRRDSGVDMPDTETATYLPSSPSLAILFAKESNKINGSC